MHPRPGPLLLGAVALVAGVARAEEPEAVVVRGEQASGFVSRARIEDSPREVTDAASLIEPLPGVHIRRLGGDDAFATLSIRGSSSSQVAVYLAGVPLTGGADPTLDLATLPLWPGARTEVHRTFAPAALGRGSLGGTLVLSPPSPRSGTRTDVWTAVGSFGSRRLRLGDVRGNADGLRVATGFSASRSDDDFSFVAPFDGATVARENAGHGAVSGLASVALPVRTPFGLGSLTSTTLAQARRQELPGPASVTTPAQRLASTRLVSALELTVPAGAATASARLWARREGLALYDVASRVPSRTRPTETDDAILALGTSLGVRASPGRSSIEARVDASAERFAPSTWVGAPSPPGARRSNAGLALDATTRVLDRITLAGSGRADVWFDSAEDGTSSSEVRPTGHVGVEGALGPVVAATHAGFVARPPSFVERYGNRGAFIGDPDLRPESAFTFDLGGRSARTFGPLRLSAETAAYATWANDLITYVFVGADSRALATNIGSARLVGLESELRASVVGIDLRVSYNATSTTNQSLCVGVGGCVRPPLPGRPRNDLVADLSYTRGPVRIRYGLDAVSGITRDNDGNLVVPGRVLHGAGVRVVAPWNLAFALDVRNLLDLRAVAYAGALGRVRAPIGDLYDYPLPGRRILVTAEWRLP